MIALLVTLALACAASAVPLPTNCGVPAISPDLANEIDPSRIVGGKEAVKNSWPWQIQLRYFGSFMCGASVLSNDWILTAAHCVYRKSASSFSIRAGRHTRTGNDRYEQVASAKALYAHESFVMSDQNNDIALIRLTKGLTFNNYVSPVCLTDKEPAGGTDAWVTGWGEVKSTCCDGNLKQALLPIVARKTCGDSLHWGSVITNTMVCAGYEDGSQSGCSGDSGGPLVIKEDGKFKQVGAVSWGHRTCTAARKPSVFSNVFYYKSWITTKISQVEREEAELQLHGRKFNMRLGAAFRALEQEE